VVATRAIVALGGKDERGLAYVKKNAIAGRQFSSWEELEAHLVRWAREVAEVRLQCGSGVALVFGAAGVDPSTGEQLVRDQQMSIRHVGRIVPEHNRPHPGSPAEPAADQLEPTCHGEG
jgi:hypothetical protein